MANNKKISQLNSLALSDYSGADLFPIVDINVLETKKITKGDLFASPGPIGTTTPNTGEFSILVAGGVPITGFSTDGTLSGDSDTVIPTEKAVKTYVDAAVGGAVKLNIINTNTDSTAVVGDVILVDTTSSDVTIELIANGNGKIVVYKKSEEDPSNEITIIPEFGSLLDEGVGGATINYKYSSLEFICDGTNFYTI